MDLIDAMNLWERIGGTFSSISNEKEYITQFVWNGVVEGHVKAVSGGIYWNWPQRLLDAKEVA